MGVHVSVDGTQPASHALKQRLCSAGMMWAQRRSVPSLTNSNFQRQLWASCQYQSGCRCRAQKDQTQSSETTARRNPGIDRCTANPIWVLMLPQTQNDRATQPSLLSRAGQTLAVRAVIDGLCKMTKAQTRVASSPSHWRKRQFTGS